MDVILDVIYSMFEMSLMTFRLGIIISHKGVRLVTHQPQPQYINKRVKILSRSTQSNIVNSARNTQCGIRFIRQSTYMMVG